MSVGIVVVSHSAALAEAAGELARGVAGDELRLALAGGVDDPEHPLGTDAVRVLQAIEEVGGDDGVLVLMDLGSAVLSAEMAVDLLPPDHPGRVVLCEAPLVEGLVAAAVQATVGADLDQVAAEARAGLAGKIAHLGTPDAAAGAAPVLDAGPALAVDAEARLPVGNTLGLHARPAARIVESVARFDAHVVLEAVRRTGSGTSEPPPPVPADSLAGIITLGVRRGDELLVRASGPDAQAAVTALRDLASDDFGDPPAAPAAASDTTGVASTDSSGDRDRVAADPGSSLRGLPAAPGLAVGEVARLDAPRPPDTPVRSVTDVEAERSHLELAIERAAAAIGTAREVLVARAGAEAGEMLAAHLLLLDDPLLRGAATSAIADEHVDAATAWRRATEAVARTYRDLDDPYLAERASDVEAVGAEVLAQLLGVDLPPVAPRGVLVVDDLGPADAARLDPTQVDALVTAEGSPTSHASLIARALGIPAVVGLGGAAAALTVGTTVLVDGTRGRVEVEPDEDALTDARRTIAAQRADDEQAQREATGPAVTRDGTHVEVAANIGLPGDAERAAAAGADGVGLLRSEFLFLDRATAPDEDEQVAVYEETCRALAGRPVVLRTLDVGGDKPLPYLDLPEEVNPFLGTRGLRLGLDRPALLTVQLRAALRVAADHPLRVMLPMVSTVAEIAAARELLEAARAALHAEGIATGDLPLGAMVEVPALALQAEALVAAVDFVSIGTNDLTQYVMAAERGNRAVAHLADPLQPAVLRLVREVCDAASAADVPVAVCGDVAGDLAAVPLLLGLGVRELSVPPPAVPVVKRAVRGCELSAATALARSALQLTSAGEVRELVAAAGPTGD